MTELDLYKFCQDKEVSWEGNELIIWIDFYDCEEFATLIGYNLTSDDGGLEVHLKDTGIALNLVDVCDYHDIDPYNILPDYERKR